MKKKRYADIERERLKSDVLLERDFLDWYANSRKKTIQRLREKLSKSKITELNSFFSSINSPIVDSVITKSLPFQDGSYIFTINKINHYFEKADKDKTLKYVSEVNFDDLLDNLNGNFERSSKLGGKQVFKEFGITTDFYYVDPEVINFAEQYNLVLGGNISRDISSRIQSELIEGIKNFEDTQQLIDRIMDVYDKGFTVNVKASLIPAYYDGDGNLAREAYERAAYSYEIPPDVYAEIVSRTENARWFNEGTLNSYKNSKVVEEVEILSAGDERVCSLCMAHEGEIIPLEEANGVLPRHCQCRCFFTAIVSVSDEEQGIMNLLNNQSMLAAVDSVIKAESAWALKNIADKINVKNIEPQIFKDINRRIEYNLGLEGDYFPDKLSSIKTVNTEENMMEMMIEKKQLKIGLMRTQKNIDDIWEYNKSFYKRYGRPWGADYWVGKGESINFTVDHELGHLLMDNIYVKNVELMGTWDAIFDDMTKKQIRNISETATEDKYEFFAETYALYLHNKKKKLPKVVIEFFDDLRLDL